MSGLSWIPRDICGNASHSASNLMEVIWNMLNFFFLPLQIKQPLQEDVEMNSKQGRWTGTLHSQGKDSVQKDGQSTLMEPHRENPNPA